MAMEASSNYKAGGVTLKQALIRALCLFSERPFLGGLTYEEMHVQSARLATVLAKILATT